MGGHITFQKVSEANLLINVEEDELCHETVVLTTCYVNQKVICKMSEAKFAQSELHVPWDSLEHFNPPANVLRTKT